MLRYRSLVVFLALGGLMAGCSSYQPTKNVWKGTKSLWYTYASPPASVNYDDKGDLSEGALRLSQCMISLDKELTRLERVMLNADKPPTQEWVSNFVITFPWVNGISGVKYDGTILGQEPPTPVKELDYIPLLYEDKKQRRNALRGDVQITPLGPEVLLAAPLYESGNFLGIVCAHFDMRTLATQSQAAEQLVVLSPYALLWAGSYDFANTPLAGVDWQKVCEQSSSGSCSNSLGKFLYQVRYLGNLPIIFAIAESGSFPKGNGSVEQGLAFFPKDRPKLSPPVFETKEMSDKGVPAFVKPEELVPDLPPPEPEPEIQKPKPQKVVQRRRVERRRQTPRVIYIEPPRETKPVKVNADLDLGPDVKGPTLPGGRPSPFSGGPQKTEKPADAAPPEKPAEPQPKPAVDTPKSTEPATQPKMLPGGRPSPFGS